MTSAAGREPSSYSSAGLLATIRAEVDRAAKRAYEVLFSDVRAAMSSISTRISAITDIATSPCIRDTSTDATSVSLPRSYVAMLDRLRTSHPGVYLSLAAVADAYDATPPLERRPMLEKAFSDIEAAIER